MFNNGISAEFSSLNWHHRPCEELFLNLTKSTHKILFKQEQCESPTQRCAERSYPESGYYFSLLLLLLARSLIIPALQRLTNY